jgi:hypothetical protein
MNGMEIIYNQDNIANTPLRVGNPLLPHKKQKVYFGWYFNANNGILNFTKEKVTCAVNRVHSIDDAIPLRMCATGFHASKKLGDAKTYVKGYRFYYVAAWGDVVNSHYRDKFRSRHRAYLQDFDSRNTILDFLWESIPNNNNNKSLLGFTKENLNKLNDLQLKDLGAKLKGNPLATREELINNIEFRFLSMVQDHYLFSYIDFDLFESYLLKYTVTPKRLFLNMLVSPPRKNKTQEVSNV